MSTSSNYTHYCPRCDKPMYFDGRCGDQILLAGSKKTEKPNTGLERIDSMGEATFEECLDYKNQLEKNHAAVIMANDYVKAFLLTGIEARKRPNFKIDPTIFSYDQLKQLGCNRWDDDLMLLPWWMHSFLKNGVVLTDVNNGVSIAGQDHIDNDIRFGMLAYGILIEKPDDNESLDKN